VKRRLVRAVVYAAVLASTLRIYSLPNDDMAGAGGGSLPRILWLGALGTLLLYLALVAGPLLDLFPRLPGRSVLVASRRAFGVSAAVTSGLHGYHGIFDWIGSFDALKYWGTDYCVSLALGGGAWIILVVLAATSFDLAARAMGPRWKRLHRGVYFAAVLVVAHAMMVTIHIINLLPVLVAGFVAVELLLVLEILRLRKAGWRPLPLLAAWALSSPPLYWSFFLIGHHRH
jgi:DMSO/TMAO reductase YedYZ heme-binding membrane subunit